MLLFQSLISNLSLITQHKYTIHCKRITLDIVYQIQIAAATEVSDREVRIGYWISIRQRNVGRIERNCRIQMIENICIVWITIVSSLHSAFFLPNGLWNLESTEMLKELSPEVGSLATRKAKQ